MSLSINDINLNNLPGVSKKKYLSSLSKSYVTPYFLIRLEKIIFFSFIEKWILYSKHLVLIVFNIYFVLLYMRKKKVLFDGSSKDFSSAFDEFKFNCHVANKQKL